MMLTSLRASPPCVPSNSVLQQRCCIPEHEIEQRPLRRDDGGEHRGGAPHRMR